MIYNVYKAASVLLLSFLCMVKGNEYPEFAGPRSVSISEDANIGSEVLRFNVSDVDGDALTVTITHDKVFQLDEYQTNLYRVLLKDTLDRETNSRYTLQITVSDGNGGGTISQEVRVRVQDVNDYTPIIRNLPLIATVRENQPPGTFIINITTDDEDMGFNAAVEIFIDDESSPFYLGDASTRQEVAHSYGDATILVNETLDYEQRSVYLVKIRATDTAGCIGDSCQPPLTTEQTLIVNVEDIQDSAPYFPGLPYRTNIVENQSVGTPVFTVLAVDGDEQNPRNIEYYFVSRDGTLTSHMEYFTIDTHSGVITNGEIIDTDSADIRAAGSVFTLSVMAKEVIGDGGSENADLDRSIASVSITVLDVNDERPSFSTNQITGTVDEELPVGSPVQMSSTLRVTDSDQGINGTFTLEVLDEYDNISQWFRVTPARAVNEAVISLSTLQRIDYETSTQLIVKVVAREVETAYETSATVTVRVGDMNDNSPVFSADSYSGRLDENSIRGDPVIMAEILSADDLDSGLYGNITYSFSGGDNVFEIDRVTGDVQLLCDGCLNSESQTVYYLNLLATDGGGLTDSAQLVITILDVNDNAPVFSNQLLTAQLREGDTTFNSPITVEATDRDEGANGLISYSVLNYTNHFGVSQNGSVYVIMAVDAEALPAQLDISIMARDSGVPALSSTCILRIQITDINDNRPTFTESPSLITIPENTNIGSVIYTVQAVDEDRSPANNEITYSLISGDQGMFTIHPQRGDIQVHRLLDRERDGEQYSLVVSAVDNGQPSQSSQQTISVKMSDVNDEAPVFTEANYRFTVSENSSPGVAVGTVRATDADLTNLLSYNISQSQAYSARGGIIQLNRVVFEINSETGAITVVSPIDRESVSKVVLMVTAEDLNGLTEQIAQSEAEIMITDINDNPPLISPVDILEITESDSLDTNILLTSLTVTDSDLSSELEYSISNNPDGAFSINNRGELKLIKPVDREVSGNWMNLTVVVQDGTNGAMSSRIDIGVFVKDVNDEYPQFTQFQSDLAVPENIEIGYELALIQAVDADYDRENRLITYAIQSGSLSKVAIDRNTGVLSVARDLDRDQYQLPNNSLSLVIEACDSGEPRLCSARDMTIRVTDVNDNSPVFFRPSYNARISETAHNNDPINVDDNLQIQATDIDAAPNGQNVIYSCCSPGNDTAGLFKINNQGQVVVASELGLRGQTGIYRLTVTATDWGTPNRTGSAVVIVHVEDYNDHNPRLSVLGDRGTTVHRPENSTVGEPVITLQTEDDDVGNNAAVDVMFVQDVSEMSDYRYFYIQPVSSSNDQFVIKQNTTFDREAKTVQYKFGVIAKDRGLPQLASNMLVITLIVDDINDNLPYFPADKQTVEVEVPEEEAGVAIGSVDYARDADERQIFCYYIIGARNSEDSISPAHEAVIDRMFTIDHKTGEIKVADGEKLDRETQEKYVLVIKADDRDENVYNNCEKPMSTAWKHQRVNTNEMELVISVQDVDDNAPVFSQPSYTVAVVRDTPPPTTLIKLEREVSDPDERQEFMFSQAPSDFDYSPSNLGSAIKVDEPVKVYDNGEIKSEITFTNKMEGSLSFGVVASDYSGHSSEVTIRVLIINSANIASFTVSKDQQEVEASIAQFRSIFIDHADWNISIVNIKPNSAKPYQTDIHIFIVPNGSQALLTAEQILQQSDNKPDLIAALHRYGFVDSEPVTRSDTSSEEKTPNKVIVIAIVVAVVLLVVMVLVLALCYVMRNKYKRKLKAAHAMAFDQGEVPQSVNNIPGSNRNSTPGTPIDEMSVTSLLYPHGKTSGKPHSPHCRSTNPVWSNNKDSQLNNFDWGNANGAFDSESHRSGHSHDDNGAIDPLNETQSCSSAGSNDWRLDIRGNNLDCSPPPPVLDDVVTAVLNEHNRNKLNSFDNKFSDSLSSHSNSRMSNHSNSRLSSHSSHGASREEAQFSRLIMNESVYGKIYETRQLPNGLETTEV